ncbi:MAG: M50 family metallopeptidase [Candidatus Eremiobacteraeota bacterium]|nr:M50 family metallopeptidase [Candidatus Eremiobacteraeota bacterium]
MLSSSSIASFEKVLTFLVMLGLLVLLHEYGHFVVARRSRVRVNEFAIGMGPKIVGWTSKRSGTLYSIRALPIGGYCAMEGEDGKTSEAEQQRDFQAQARTQGAIPAGSVNFQAKSTWQRLGIVLAGPLANFVLAFAILLIGALAFGVPSDKVGAAIVTQVVANTPAAANGLRPGDRIVSLAIEGKAVTAASALIDEIHRSLGKHIDVTYLRAGTTKTIHVVPVPCPQNARQGCIGFVPEPAFERVGILESVKDSGLEFYNIAGNTFMSIGLLATKFTTYASQVSGPIGMGQAATVVQDFGWGPYLTLAATISFALGLFNLLPIPALDGGRAAFIVAEMLRGKPVDPEKEAMVHITGLAALMALMLLVAFHDIVRIVSGKGVL